MKNINKSNIMGLIGMDVINIKNEVVGTVVGDFNGKYIINVDGEEKFYSESTLIRNWKIVEDETENAMNENDEVIEEETEEVIDEENAEDENKPNEVVEEETEEVINENDETEEFVLETENRGIIDNIKETEGKVKITGHLYGVPVKFDKINQTTVWKTLIKLYDNRKDENDKYSLDDKKYLVRQLKQLNEEVFAGAFRCLVSKTKQNYIEELMK